MSANSIRYRVRGQICQKDCPVSPRLHEKSSWSFSGVEYPPNARQRARPKAWQKADWGASLLQQMHSRVSQNHSRVSNAQPGLLKGNGARFAVMKRLSKGRFETTGPATEDHAQGPVTEDHTQGPVTEDHVPGPVTEDHVQGPVTVDHVQAHG
jgi:hypothetical protein